MSLLKNKSKPLDEAFMNDDENNTVSSMPEVDSQPLTVGHLRKWEYFRSRSQTNMARTLYALIATIILILGALGTYMSQSFVSQHQFLEYQNVKNEDHNRLETSLQEAIVKSIAPIRDELNNLRTNISEIRFVLNSEKFVTSERFLTFKEDYLSLKEQVQKLELRFAIVNEKVMDTWTKNEQSNFVNFVEKEISDLEASINQVQKNVNTLRINVAEHHPNIKNELEK